MRVNTPSDTELADLIELRDPASVTIYLPSSPLPVEREHLQFVLRQRAIVQQAVLSALDDAEDPLILRGSGKAVSQLTEVVRAATAGAMSELLFDLEATTLEGHIDAAGAIASAEGTSPTTYGLLEEIAARVPHSGGTVRAVRKEDLPENTPVAAILRYPPVP